MKLSIYVLYDELKKYSPKLHTNHTNIPAVLQIRELNAKYLPVMSYEHIYYADKATIEKHADKLSGFELISFGFIDDDILQSNDLSVIMVDETARPYEVICRVQNSFEKYVQWENSVLELIAKRANLKTVADKIATVLTNPFVLIESSSRVLLAAGKIPENPSGSIWENVMKAGHTSNIDKGRDYLAHEREFDSHNRSVFFSELGNFREQGFLNANVFYRGNRVARMSASDIYAPFTPGQTYLFRSARNLIELAIESDTFSESISDHDVSYIEKLLRGQNVDSMIVNYHLAKRGWNNSDWFSVFYVQDRQGRTITDSFMKRFNIPMSGLRRRALFFQYENAIVLIARKETLRTDDDLESTLRSEFRHFGLTAGASDTFRGFHNIRHYYEQSKIALQEAKSAESSAEINPFDDYYFTHILRTLTEAASLESLVDPRILELSLYDAERKTDYVECLEAYLLNGGNMAKASAALYTHRNTFTYKIGRIFELIGAEGRELEAEERMKLWFSIKIKSTLDKMAGRLFSRGNPDS